MNTRLISFIFLIFLSFISGSDVFAGSIATFPLGAPEVSCAWANATLRLYIPNGTISLPIYPADNVQYPNGNVNNLVQIMDSSRIGVFNQSASANCSAGWERQSWIVPGDGQWYMSLGRPSSNPTCTISRPALPSPAQPAVQFVYQNDFKEQIGTLPGQTSPYFYVHIDGSVVNLTNATVPDNTKRQWSALQTHLNECDSFFVSYCGDGVVDNGAMQTSIPGVGTQPLNVSEQCDLGAQNGQVGSACSATCTPVSVPPVIPPGGGGGGGGPTCTPGNFVRDAGGVVPAPISAATPGLCPVGEAVGNFTDTPNGSNHSYKWSCNSIGAGLACTAFYNIVSGGGWGGGPTPTVVTVPGSSSFCWNGVVERPNAAGQYENCDTTALWCQSCNIIDTTPGSVSPGKLSITTPGNSSMDINTYRLIIWNGVPVFSVNDRVSFETNIPIYLENKTATITNRSPLLNGSTITKIINNVWVGGSIRFKTGETRDASGNLLTITYDQRAYPSSTILFGWSELQWLKGDTSGITWGYDDTIVTNPTYRSQGLYASLQYLEAPFHVRVSRPIIGNVAGGSAFIGSALGNSVNTIVQTFFNNLRSGNFTTSTVNSDASYALSSATRSVSDDSALSQKIASGSVVEEWAIARSSVNTSGIYMVTSIDSESQIDSKSTPLGDTASIRVFKDGDVSINGDIDLTKVRTVIIENGNLIINKDIRYADKSSSLAWIVKNGNIIIADSVKNIAGVFVTLAGAIESNGVSTPNRLTVDGSLYGNTADLVNNRSYVRGQTGYSALNVWVVVNYSNRAIMNPPPFLSRFLDQYSLERVVR